MRSRALPAAAALLAAVALASSAAAQPPATTAPARNAVVTVDLAAAVELALARNPALGAVEERRREVEGGVEEVRADAFPQLSALASYGASRNPAFLNSPDFEDLLDQFPEGSFEPSEQRLWSAGVELSQPIYTFGKLSAAIDLAEVVVDVTEAQIDAARLDLAFEAADAYYEVLDARQSLAVGALQERVRRESLEVVQARYDLGEATRLELLRAEAALAEVTPTIAALTGEVETAESRLRRVLGLEPGEMLVVEGALPPELLVDPPTGGAARDLSRAATAGVLGGLPALDGPPEPPPFEALAATALARRPELADLDLQQRVLALRQRVTAAEGKPQVELDGFVGRQARVFENVSDPLYDDYRVSLGVNWSFFDGGRRRGQIAQLESQRRQVELERRDLAAAIRLEVEQALIDYRTAVARFRAAAVASAASREAARVARESYEEGVALLTDWLDAQRQET
ncbi:MAG TPA: TolC family protein, partial [Thermoanaerobaculia bacterium]|nr:TolC family protein [Thermoanaerobaculia bacterium]